MLYHEMSSAEARAAYEEFMAERPVALERLRIQLAELGLDPGQVLDKSLTSLRTVQEAVCPLLSLRPQPWNTYPTEGPSWARYDLFPPRVTVESTWLIDGVATDFSDVLQAAIPGTTWKLGKRDTIEKSYRNHPLLVHGANYSFPPRIVLTSMQERAFPKAGFDPDLSLSGHQTIRNLTHVPEPRATQPDEVTVSLMHGGDPNLQIRFDADLVFECRPVLTTIMRRLRREPGILDARWKGNRILVNAPTWTAERMKAWWVAELEREFAGPI